MVVKNHRQKSWLAAAALVAAALPSWAQVRVIDSTPVGKAVPNTSVATVAPANSAAELYIRLQSMEQELLELRGLVEQQSYEIKRLKQQRMDDYTDLDQRISALMSKSSNVGPVTTAPSVTTSSPSSSTTLSSSEPPDERELYSDALNLLLQNKDFDASATKLTQYLEFYPDGLFAPNAYYWLGEISLSKQDLPGAKQWFSELINRFPGHGKVPDAKFKLGKVYFQLGDKTKARSLLSEVAQGSSAAAQLAQEFMSVNSL
ncbi:YbgF trimerization domain-containing protein [Halioxenophilus sp. WMMB6]|uniref:YbgF trimerization domain-containing protein n=1 Tax=Halioxenophilus sp. WMMB6 TaxID=3073815 RepID=UPI00295EC5D4|nr:tetratricopeptide repeat protein [Halioxenophilus sp. WMMB6]